MRYITRGLAGVFAICLVIRVGAWLVAPAIPALAVLLFVAAVLQLMLFGRRH